MKSWIFIGLKKSYLMFGLVLPKRRNLGCIVSKLSCPETWASLLENMYTLYYESSASSHLEATLIWSMLDKLFHRNQCVDHMCVYGFLSKLFSRIKVTINDIEFRQLMWSELWFFVGLCILFQFNKKYMRSLT